MNAQVRKEVEQAIQRFNREERQTQTSSCTVEGKKYFIKVCGKERGKYQDNEVNALRCLAAFSPFYADYFIGSVRLKGRTGLVLRFIEGTDLYDLVRSKQKWSVEGLINLYELLLSKIRVYHDHLLTHGDIKATNFFIHSVTRPDGTEDTDIDLIDTESVNNFNSDQRKRGQPSKFVNFVSASYDLPVKVKRCDIQFRGHRNAFLFYKYLDLYSISVLILYLYQPRVYTMIKTRGQPDNVWKVGKRQRRPSEFVKKPSNALERALHYVFSFLPVLERHLEESPIVMEDLCISHRRLARLLSNQDEEKVIQRDQAKNEMADVTLMPCSSTIPTEL